MATTYTTVEDFQAYMGQFFEVEDPATIEDVIRRAELDIDDYVGLVPGDSGLAFDPETLEDPQKKLLSLATCNQTEYRLAMGEPFFTGMTQHQEGADFSPKKTPARVAPFAKRTLVRAGLVQLTGRFT